MSIYTIYKKDTLEIVNKITTLGNISNFLSEDEYFLNDNLNKDDHYITTINGITLGKMKTDIPVEVVCLSCYADSSYNTIFKNIPKDTEISIGDTYYGILSEVENLEISLDTNDIYIIKMNNSSYNLSSQTFKLTAYEN
tara:strand:+ start:35 stop:451 length:417 start_codon:yes stop_codon:yes gene_type:complete